MLAMGAGSESEGEGLYHRGHGVKYALGQWGDEGEGRGVWKGSEDKWGKRKMVIKFRQMH